MTVENLEKFCKTQIKEKQRLIEAHNSDYWFDDNQLRAGYILAMEEVLDFLP